MSRSGYCDEIDDQWANIRWRGAVNSAINGKRGQDFLRKLLGYLDVMPEKRLVAGELEENGEFCALGVAGQAMGLNLAAIDTYDIEQLSSSFNIAEAMAREIMFINDDCNAKYEYVDTGEPYPNQWKLVACPDTGAGRWRAVCSWVESRIKEQEK